MAESDRALAFKDINPVAPTHALIIPKVHVDSLAALDPNDEEHRHSMTEMFELAGRLGQSHPNGWRLVTNVGREGGQAVGHLHLHFLAGRQFTWPPG